MKYTPVKHRPLARQRSSPCIALGISPSLPDEYISPVTPPLLKKSRSRPRIHRGDVSSSASSVCGSDSAPDSDMDTTPKQLVPSHTPPKRRVVGVMEPMTTGRPKASKRDTLQARLQAAAALRSSKSMDAMSPIPPVPPLPTLPSSPSSSRISPKRKYPGAPYSPEKLRPSKSDKVVVCVRVKPTVSLFAGVAYNITDTSISLSDAHPNVIKRGGKGGRDDEYTYTFDKLLHHPSTTPQLYSSKIAPLVDKAMLGFNTTVFAYGATASGKSYTMTGTPAELGIIPCAIDGVFDAINNEVDREFLLRVSYLEIYNETIRDLLNFKSGPQRDDEKPSIHTDKGKVYVHPLAESVVSTPQHVVDLLDKGNRLRRVGVTDWNERSSRSHSVFTIVIESRPRDGHGDDEVRLSRLSLIDLAGSEKAASDVDRRGEGKHINQSLLALREVINKLTEKKRSHVPYRNSKLTHLLENALGGDSNICVICTLSFEEAHHAETLETLKFAGRCSQVETRAQKNILFSDDQALIRAKDKEIQILRQQLQAIKPIPSSSTEQLSDSVAAMEERKARLAQQLAQLNAEILTSEVLPRSSTGILSPLPKRRRISDIHAFGTGTPKKNAQDRRAVSNTLRVVEENEQPHVSAHLAQPFDNELIAALRKSLAAKEEELREVNRELAHLTSRLSELPERQAEIMSLKDDLSSLTSKHEALERDAAEMRTGLRDQIVEKSAQIDRLEQAIMEVRKSHEDLIIEDSRQLKETQDQLEATRIQLLTKVESDNAQQSALRASCARLEEDCKAKEAAIQETAAACVEQLESLRNKCAKDMESARQEDAQALEALRTEMGLAIDKQRHAWEEERSMLQTARQVAEEAVLSARKELERFQKASMESETRVVTELKSQVEEAREQARTVEERSSRENMTLQRQLEAEREQTVAAKSALESQHSASLTTIARLEEAQKRCNDEKSELSTRIAQQQILVDKLQASERASHEQLRGTAEREKNLSHATAKLQQREAELLAELSSSRETMDRNEADYIKRLAVAEAQRAAAEEEAWQAAARYQRSEDALRSVTAAQRTSQRENDDIASALRSEVDALKVELEETKARESKLIETRESIGHQERQIREDVARLRDETDRILSIEKRKAEDALASSERYKSLLEEASKAGSKGQAENNALVDEVRRLKADLEALQCEHKQCRSDIDVERAKRDESGQSLDMVKGELIGVKEQVYALEAENQRLRQESQIVRERQEETREAAAERLLVQLRGSDHIDPESALWNSSNPSDEIDRLGKIVEAQRIIIEEQKAKIKFWARELEQQREIVRALTMNPDSPEAGGSHRNNPQAATPLAESPIRRVRTVNKKLSSTFTAFNLAMPSAPTPLPMHPSQVDNTLGRKGRRLTIEHDIGLLTDSSKINKARAVFDRFDETPPSKMGNRTRSGGGMPVSVPKQRRP